MIVETIHAALFLAIGGVLGWLLRDHQLREYVENARDRLSEMAALVKGLGGEHGAPANESGDK